MSFGECLGSMIVWYFERVHSSLQSSLPTDRKWAKQLVFGSFDPITFLLMTSNGSDLRIYSCLLSFMKTFLARIKTTTLFVCPICALWTLPLYCVLDSSMNAVKLILFVFSQRSLSLYEIMMTKRKNTSIEDVCCAIILKNNSLKKSLKSQF